ncbi:MAG: conserved membrane protein of unknown function [Nitrospira sp.]|nr:MAG: conserved membrane protein of unknown function [Nitrospira sp.]
MAEQPDEKSKLPLTGLVALVLAAVSSLIIYQVPLKTSRPVDKDAEIRAFVTGDHVQSRLWQDPFEALLIHQLKEKSGLHSEESRILSHEFHDLIREIKQAGAPDEFRVLPVFVDGSPYASGVESRLRERYAVVSALGAAGYLPESGEYIRFFEWRQEREPTVVVPAEWFLPGSNPLGAREEQHVLVLWLKDQDFSPNPLESLSRLVAHLNGTLRQYSATYRVLGPRTSGTLAAMLRELKSRRPYMHALKGMMFYSSWATAVNSLLLPESHEAKEGEIENLFADQGLSLLRTIGTDDQLAEQLVEELNRRGVDLALQRKEGWQAMPRVALISEWDTVYGRALPLTFVAMAETMAKMRGASGIRKIEPELAVLRAGTWPEWVHRIAYLAGLDGELPPRGDDKDSGETQGGRRSGDQGGRNLGDKTDRAQQSKEEAPEGRGQIDYVRRLAAALKQVEAQGNGEFAAIGVLGSDVYDKLLLLQALRSNFPHAIFFTTDLDTRITHPAQWQWTRNLIVASHFGLEIDHGLMDSYPPPPFRDSYQTSLFYAALQALGHVVSNRATGELLTQSGVKFSNEVKARLYEVGRHGAVDISPARHPEELRSIQTPRLDLDPRSGKANIVDARTMILVISAMGVLMLFVFLLTREFWEVLRTRCFGVTVLFTVVLVIVVVGLLLWAKSDGAGGEPFSLTDGISVWPSTIIHLIAFVLCTIFIWYSSIKLRENERELIRRFRFVRPKTAVVLSPSMLGIHHWARRTDHAAVDLWQEYQSLGQWQNRLARILPQTICYGVLLNLLMRLFGYPAMPCRGPACFEINYLMSSLSMLGMIFVIFYVVDATRLCGRLIEIMIEGKIQWPDKLLAKEAIKRDVDEAYLDELLGIELIAKRTDVISFMLYYPFIILFLMGVARHTYFDRWDFPVGLMVIFGLNAAYALGNAIYLRRSAEEAKREAVKGLRAKLNALSIKTPFKSRKAQQIAQVINLIEKNQEGAFLPFTQHPLFGAIALPTGGTGLVFLFEYLATIF